MYLKTHFKFPFKSSKNSTTKASIIFFINTTLLKEHYKISFTIFESTQLHLSIFKDAHKTENKRASFFTAVADRRDLRNSDPTCQRNGTEQRRCTIHARPELVDGEFPGGGIFTTRPTRPGAHVGLARRADKRREGRRRWPWRLGGVGRWRYAGGGHGDPS